MATWKAFKKTAQVSYNSWTVFFTTDAPLDALCYAVSYGYDPSNNKNQIECLDY